MRGKATSPRAMTSRSGGPAMTSLLALPPPPPGSSAASRPGSRTPKGGFPGPFERHGGNFQVPSARFLSLAPGPAPASLPRPYSWPRPAHHRRPHLCTRPRPLNRCSVLSALYLVLGAPCSVLGAS